MCLNERYCIGSNASTSIKEICIFIQQIPPVVGMTVKGRDSSCLQNDVEFERNLLILISE